MRFIRDILAQQQRAGKPAISFEFFTPKTTEGDRKLLELTIPGLLKFKPDYCSVTYGAGGTTREKTLGLVNQMQHRFQIPGMAHLTCAGSTREQLAGIVTQIRSLGIRNILALRGDPPGGTGDFVQTPGGFEFARDLVAYIRTVGDFSIGVAGFPEGHIACPDGKLTDWRYLKEKIDAGADFVVTQLFFDNTDFYEFRDHLTRELGVAVPIIPGILPILSRNQIQKFAQLCGARLPGPFRARLDEFGDDDVAVTNYGIEYATRQCSELLSAGAPGLHFYTLNKSYSTLQVLLNLGLA